MNQPQRGERDRCCGSTRKLLYCPPRDALYIASNRSCVVPS